MWWFHGYLESTRSPSSALSYPFFGWEASPSTEMVVPVVFLTPFLVGRLLLVKAPAGKKMLPL